MYFISYAYEVKQGGGIYGFGNCKVILDKKITTYHQIKESVKFVEEIYNESVYVLNYILLKTT